MAFSSDFAGLTPFQARILSCLSCGALLYSEPCLTSLPAAKITPRVRDFQAYIKGFVWSVDSLSEASSEVQ